MSVFLWTTLKTTFGKEQKHWAGEMVQWLKTFTALAEDPMWFLVLTSVTYNYL